MNPPEGYRWLKIGEACMDGDVYEQPFRCIPRIYSLVSPITFGIRMDRAECCARPLPTCTDKQRIGVMDFRTKINR